MHRSTLAFAVCFVACLVYLQLNVAAADHWPQWRGPGRDGHVTSKSFPDALGEDRLKKRWSVKIGPGYSGPIVTDKLVISVETENEEREVVRAFDRKSGKQAWQAYWAGSMNVPFFARANGSWARATPAFDGEHLYVAGMRDVLACIEVASGKIVWRADFVERYKTPLPAFGFVSSPLVLGDYVYIQAGASLLKLNKKTGETVWRTLVDGGGTWGSAFASPTVAEIHGKTQLLVQTRNHLAGVDPKNGDVLWQVEVEAFRGMNILTPLVLGNKIYTSAYGGRSHAFAIEHENGKWSVGKSWDNRQQAYMTTPVVVDGKAYLLLRNQRVTCVDLENGDILWLTEERFGKYWSMVTDGKRILALDQRGGLVLFNANPEKFEMLEKRRITEQESWAHIAVVGDEVYVRALNELIVFTWK